MKSNAPGYRRLVALAMKYMVKTTMELSENDRAECLVCGWSCPPGFPGKVIPGAGFWSMESHIKDHIERDEITGESLKEKLSGGEP